MEEDMQACWLTTDASKSAEESQAGAVEDSVICVDSSNCEWISDDMPRTVSMSALEVFGEHSVPPQSASSLGLEESASHVQGLGRRLSRSYNLRFVDETQQHYSRGDERVRGSNRAWPLRLGGSGIVDVRQYVFGHPLLSTEAEKMIVWADISNSPGSHLDLLKALSRGDTHTFERLLYSTITQAKQKYDLHFQFWIGYFTRLYEQQVADMLLEDPHFLITSMSGVDPRDIQLDTGLPMPRSRDRGRGRGSVAGGRSAVRRHSADVV